MCSTKIEKNAVLVYGHVYSIWSYKETKNKITDFFMILAWDCSFHPDKADVFYINMEIKCFFNLKSS